MSQERRGTVLGVAAYLCWGLFPLYWPLLEPGSAIEILAHRIVWSFAFVLVVLLGWRSAGRRLPRDRRRIALLSAASALIGVNWGLYIWGVNHHHVVETSLGYFVNPLVSVALAVLVLRERLRRIQWVAVAVAAIGVLVLTLQSGRPPWIALALAFSFGGYGLIKAVIGIGAVEGLFVETTLLAPVALLYLLTTADAGAHFTGHGPGHALLLVSAGPITALPLLAFAGAASRVPLSRLGLMQYLTPTMQFLIGVLVRHEPMNAPRLTGFVLVWVALFVFTIDTATHRRRQLALAAQATAI